MISRILEGSKSSKILFENKKSFRAYREKIEEIIKLTESDRLIDWI